MSKQEQLNIIQKEIDKTISGEYDNKFLGESKMSINYVNRINDEDIIDIMRTIMDNGTGKAETRNEHILIKLMQIRNTPIKTFEFDQEKVDFHYKYWMEEMNGM